MPIYKNINGIRKKANVAFLNDKIIPEIYYGDKLVYQFNGVVFEKSTPGTYTINIPLTGYYSIILVGGGGGGAHARWTIWNSTQPGGSGAMCQGTLYLSAGKYNIVVGGGGVGVSTADTGNTITGGTGGTTSAFGQSVSGGFGGVAYATYGATSGHAGAGGTASVSSGITGTNGITGDTTGLYNGYGAGGVAGVTGANGYARISFVSQE